MRTDGSQYVTHIKRKAKQKVKLPKHIFKKEISKGFTMDKLSMKENILNFNNFIDKYYKI
jgi:hypothetical protein